MKKRGVIDLCLILLCASVTVGAQDRVTGLMESYRFAEAVQVLDSALAETELLSQQRELVLMKAACLKKLYRFDGAVQVLTEWNEKWFALAQTFDYKVISELAECHSLSGNYEGALSAYTLLTTADPGNLYFALQRAMILYKLENYQEAVVAGKELLRRDSMSVTLLTLVGNGFNKMGKGDSALVYYDRVLRIKPMDVATINKKAGLLFSAGRSEEVVSLTGDYLAKDSTNLTI